MHRRLIVMGGLMVYWLVFTAMAPADDHIVREQKRTYMGRTTPPRTSEIWISVDKVYFANGPVVTITRYDLKKRWTILPERKRYIEEPLPDPTGPAENKNKSERIQEAGFNYSPKYDWVLRDPDKREKVEGQDCRFLILEGEADYAQEMREIWVATDTPIDCKRYFKLYLQPNLDPEMASVYKQTPALTNGIVLKSRTVTEPAIAPTIIWESRIVKMEAAAPPAGIYDLPAGFQKVANEEALYSD